MFLRASRSGGKTYWSVVETVRDGGRWPKHRTVYKLGRHETREAAQAAWDARLKREDAQRRADEAQEDADPLRDAFRELGLKPDASADHVRAAYRRLAAANHPDRGGNPDAMVTINRAYEFAMQAVERGERPSSARP